MRVSELFSSARTGAYSLFTWIALILLAGLLASQAVSLWLNRGERTTVVSQARGFNLAVRIADSVRILEAAEPAKRSSIISTLQSDDFEVTPIAEDQISSHSPRGQIPLAIAQRLGSEREIRSTGMGGGMGNGMGAGMGGGLGPGAGGMHGAGRMQNANLTRGFDVRLNDGQWIRFVAFSETAAPSLPNTFYFQLALSLLIVVTVVLFAVRQATRPLQTLALAADKLGHNLDAAPLDETGPTEMRRAAQAFNHMQVRIKRLIDERARALAAVSHDLRTPLTRLRLRAELVDDESLRDQMAADLDSMAAMIDATLDYLRGLQDNEPFRPIDINALLQSFAEDAQVIGRQVAVQGNAAAPYSGRLSALRRALQNLIDNAIKYGRNATIRIEDDDATLRLIVEDSGPGIDPSELGRVAEPYYRPDVARRSDTGGSGLGLSIVRDIALMHGGDLQLANRPEGGLAATLRLPRKASGSSPETSPG